jgi:hypothetical protein
MNEQATLAFRVINDALASDPKTREPMNALVIWTELGKGLAGLLETLGADLGLFRSIIQKHCEGVSRSASVDPNRWFYRLAPEERLDAPGVAEAIRRIEHALEQALPQLSAEASQADEGRKNAFLAVAKGWFPVGLEILKAIPAARGADELERLAVLWAWCERYLPASGATPAELGVRVER